MNIESRFSVQRVVDEAGRQQVIEVLRATYLREKRWVSDPEGQIPPEDLQCEGISWFVVSRRSRPAGVLRVRYDPPVAAYAKYGFKLLDPNLPVESFLREHRIAEVGRGLAEKRVARDHVDAGEHFVGGPRRARRRSERRPAPRPPARWG